MTTVMRGPLPQTLKAARESFEREIVQDALRRHRGKITSAALELGVSRPTLYELIEKLRIGRDSSVPTAGESDSLTSSRDPASGRKS